MSGIIGGWYFFIGAFHWSIGLGPQQACISLQGLCICSTLWTSGHYSQSLQSTLVSSSCGKKQKDENKRRVSSIVDKSGKRLACTLTRFRMNCGKMRKKPENIMGKSQNFIPTFGLPPWRGNTVKWKRLSVDVPPAFPKLYSHFATKSLFLLWIERHTQIHYVMSWRHTVAISHGNSLQAKAWKSHFLTLWPWPLTYDLDLQSQPS